MSAARWRAAMRSSASGAIMPRASRPGMSGRPTRWTRGAAAGGSAGAATAMPGDAAIVKPRAAPAPRARGAQARATDQTVGDATWWHAIRPRHAILALVLLIYPLVASPFFTFQIGGQALVLGLIALSLAFLGGYGGMVCLSQMTIAGLAGYGMAILGHSSVTQISLGWPVWLAAPVSVLLATVVAVLIGLLSVRTEGIYTIMITLAIGVAFYYFTQQNYDIFNGFQGFSQVLPPPVFGIDWRAPLPFYYLALFWACAGYFFVKYLVRTPFGIALQGVRDNPRRMSALGFDVTAHRLAAHAVAGFMAAVAGVLFVWYNGRISPGTIGTGAILNVLIIAVLGGMRHPVGAFLGALVFVLLQNFAIDLVDRERFNLVIGGVVLTIVLFSPDGLLGLWRHARGALRPAAPGRSAGARASRLGGRPQRRPIQTRPT